MKNEELAMLIQEGRQDLVEDLWLQTERFISAYAKKFYYTWSVRCVQMCLDTEDLYQAGYFALLHAAEKYQNDKGSSFINYLALWLKAEFYKACKMNYVGWQKKASYSICEIDEVVENTITSNCDTAQEAVETVYNEQVKAEVEAAVNSLSASQKETIQLIYYDGYTYQACADKLGLSKGSVSRSTQRAFVHLRKQLNHYKEREVA